MKHTGARFEGRGSRAAILAVCAVLVFPFVAAAQATTSPDGSSAAYQFARQGVFGCNLTGSYAMSVGAMSAVGGVYVPVNDAAVTLNTGYLVYKECVLRGIVNREKESVVAATTKKITLTTLTGRDGKPLYAQQPSKEKLSDFADPTVLKFLQNDVKDPLVQRALAQRYMEATRKPASLYTCPYNNGNMTPALNGSDTSAEAKAALRNPLCNRLFSYFFTGFAMDRAASERIKEAEDCLDWGRGFYCLETTDADGNPAITTPSSLIEGSTLQAVTSGFRITETANDIDQMPGALLAGLTSQIMSSAQGLTGLLQKIGSQPSYLDQVAAESAAGLRNAAANAAIQTLTAALQVEKTYNQVVSSIASTLTGSIAQLRTIENQCWGLVIQNVCATALAADNTCTSKPQGSCTTDPSTGQQTCPQGVTLLVATSTAASQQIIQSQITPLANQTLTNINNSNDSLRLINQLITGVTNTTSVDAQRIALVQLDQLVAQGALHNQTQLTTVQQQQAAIKDSIGTLVNDTKTAWADSTDPNIGWCNVNNPSVIQMWIQRWTK